MRKHTVRRGQTIEDIAIKYYYNASRYPDILAANNLPSKIIYEGMTLKIPEDPREFPVTKFNEVGVTINDKDFYFWTSLKLNFSRFSIANTFQFSAPYEPENELMREAFRPFSFAKIKIYYANELMLTGYIVRVTMSSSEQGNVVTVDGYGLPGILQKTTLPYTLYPRTTRGGNLADLARDYTKPFGVFPIFSSGATAISKRSFKSTSIQPSESIAAFLIRLAKQRGLLVTSTPKGELFFALPEELADTKPPISIGGKSTDLSATYDGNEMYSDVTALVSRGRGSAPTVAAEKIDLEYFKHTTVERTDDDDGDLADLAKSEVKRILTSAMSFAISLPYWDDAEGLVLPDRKIIVENPATAINTPTTFVITDVALEIGASKTADVEMVPQSALAGEMEAFWI